MVSPYPATEKPGGCHQNQTCNNQAEGHHHYPNLATQRPSWNGGNQTNWDDPGQQDANQSGVYSDGVTSQLKEGVEDPGNHETRAPECQSTQTQQKAVNDDGSGEECQSKNQPVNPGDGVFALGSGIDQHANSQRKVEEGKETPDSKCHQELGVDRTDQTEIEIAIPELLPHTHQCFQAGTNEQVADGADNQIDSHNTQGGAEAPAIEVLDLAEEDKNSSHCNHQIECITNPVRICCWL